MSQSNANDIAIPESLEALKELIKQRVEEACESTPAWYWQIDEDVNLRNYAKNDADKVHNLLFGRMDDVTNEWDDHGHNGDGQRASNVKDELETIIDKDLADVIEAFAEANDLDPDDLAEELKEDDEFEHWNLDVPSIETVYKYQGDVHVVARTPISLSLTPDSSLFASLTYLGVSQQAYLDACTKFIDENDLDFENPGAFEDAVADIPDSSMFDNLAKGYEHVFWEAVKMSDDSALFADLPQRPPVVDPGRLVEFITKNADLSSVYLHTTGCGDTVEDVGNELACHGVDLKSAVLYASGTLSAENNPDYLDDQQDLELKASIPVEISDLTVRSESPNDSGNGFSLSPDFKPEADLYRALFDSDRSEDHAKKRKLGSDDIAALVDAIPLHRLESFVKERWYFRDDQITDIGRDIKARLLERLARPMAPETLSKELLGCLAPSQDHDDGKQRRALWLIAHGADVDASLDNGVTALMLAARRKDVTVLKALIEAGADVNREAIDPLTGFRENAMSIAVRKDMYGRDPQSCKGILIEAGARLPQPQVRRGQDKENVESTLIFAIDGSNPELVRRAADDLRTNGAESMQDELNLGLYRAARKLDQELGFALVEKGANPSGAFQARVGAVVTIKEALHQYCAQIGRPTEAHDNYLALMHAHIARQALGRIADLARATRKSAP